jgi:predicted Fe-S protein YdhL (DUF1289 family)
MTRTSPPPEGQGPVPSPCNSICAIDQVTGFCAGCFRTLDEVAAWSVLDDIEKRAVWAALPVRRADCAKRDDAVGAPRTGTDGQR